MKKQLTLKDLLFYYSSAIFGIGVVGIIVQDFEFALTGILFAVMGATTLYFVWGKKVQ